MKNDRREAVSGGRQRASDAPAEGRGRMQGGELYLVSFWRLSRDDAQRARIVGQLRKTEKKQPGADH